MAANLENSAVAKGLDKVSFHSNPKERQCQRMLNCTHLLHSCTHSHASKVMLKILQARLQQYVNRELPDVQGGFRKGRGTRNQIANMHWIIAKAREFQKNIYFCFIYATVDHNKLWKILKDMGIPDHLTCLLRNLYRRRRWYPTPVLLPGKSHGQRSLVGCGPWGLKELDITEQLPFP